LKRTRRNGKNKYIELWGNWVPLSNYKGIENINVNYMLKRRKLRYKYEVANWKVFGDEKQKKRVQNLREHLHRRSPQFSRTKVVEFCYFKLKDFSNMMIKFSLSSLVSCGKIFKFHMYNNKHQRINVGKRRPSTWEDG
jgi:hypothetical protein